MDTLVEHCLFKENFRSKGEKGWEEQGRNVIRMSAQEKEKSGQKMLDLENQTELCPLDSG